MTPYRLEMQAKGAPEGYKDLYEFWGGALLEELLLGETKEPLILNLASKEMQAKGAPEGYKDLYEFWGGALLEELLLGETKEPLILNLASKEYSKCIEAYLRKKVRFVTCVFGEYSDGRVVQKGTMAKMARGEMVRFLAETQAEGLEDVKAFGRLEYRYVPELSGENELVFLR